MRELLMDKWGMGTHLTDAIMSVWGGECNELGCNMPAACCIW